MPQADPITYASYLKVPELLELQQPKSSPEEHDEMLFIVIHQVYELWFKQMLHEGDLLKTLLQKDQDELAFATLKRMLTVLKTMVSQIDILETKTFSKVPVVFNRLNFVNSSFNWATNEERR
jgi:tryptophan 2,3-dioxygenase